MKLLTGLLMNQGAKMQAVLKADASWIADTLGHLEAAALHDWWGKLWAQDAAFTGFLLEKGAVDTLLAQFKVANAVKHSDVGQMLVDVIGSAQWENALVQALTGDKYANALMALLDASNPSASRYVPRVLGALFRLMKVSSEAGSEAAKKALDAKAGLDKHPALVRLFLSKLSGTLKLLAAPATKKMKMQDNITVDTVGPQRIALLELVRFSLPFLTFIPSSTLSARRSLASTSPLLTRP